MTNNKVLTIAALSLLGSNIAPMANAAAPDGTHPIPDIARAMLDVAYESGDPAEIEAVTKAVKSVFPDYAEAIENASNAEIAKLAQETPVVDAAAASSEAASDDYGTFALSPWDGKISATGLRTTGNSDNAAVGIAIDAARTAGAITHNFKAFLDLGESNGVTNQKRWGAAYKLDYALSDRTYAYGRVSYEQDQFSGFDYRLFSGAGLGHYFFKGEPFSWKVEGGPGYRYSPLDGSDLVEQNFAVYASSEIAWLIRDGVTLEQDFNTTWTSPTTTFQSVTSLTTQIWGDISTGLSYEYRYETDPPAGRENSDTIAKASLIYGF